MTTRVLVTGSRTWTDPAPIAAELSAYRAPGAVLVHGGAPGADRIAAAIWRGWGLPTEEHPAQWAAHGRAAGMRRNQHMVTLGAQVCLAFIHDNSPGASHCADIAQRAGIRTHRRRTGDRPASTDLFGAEIPDTRPRTGYGAPDGVTNDIDDVLDVLRVANRDGYGVVGTRQHVWRLVVAPMVEPIPRYEADTVRQLLDNRWLTIGGRHVWDYRGDVIEGRAVLVPRHAQQWLARWATRKPLGQPAKR